MKKTKPNISVIVPIYNVEPYLCRCIDSLLKQTYSNFELILVDDGSPDNCGTICDAYAKRDSRVLVIHKINGGLSDARNAGLKIAQGEFIAFVDSDDWVAVDYLEKLYTALITTNSDICECIALKTDGSDIPPNVPPSAPSVYESYSALEQLIHDGPFHQHVWNKLYRKSVITDVFFPMGKTHEDEFWTYQVFGKAKKISKISDVLYFYFQRPGSIMNETYSLRRLDALEAKLQRQKYVDTRFPELSLLAKLNLFGSCIYAGQMSLLYLTKEQQLTARQKINEIISQCKPTLKDCTAVSGSNKLWFFLAKGSFWTTCQIKNYLKKGF